jgi:hypothetical protein
MKTDKGTDSGNEQEPPDDVKEEASTQSSEGVSVPEDFQKEVHGVMQKATSKHHIEHVRSKVNERDDELRNEAMKKQKGKKSDTENFSMVGAPSSLSY